MGDNRPPKVDAGERATLVAFLDYVREAVIAKAHGVSEIEGRTAGVPSGTNLLGLIRHLTAAEDYWFPVTFAGKDQDIDFSMQVTPDETGPSLIAAYRAAIVRSNEIAMAGDLDQLSAQEPTRTLRWILIHMVEETSRHAGHADILREQIDGAIGR